MPNSRERLRSVSDISGFSFVPILFVLRSSRTTECKEIEPKDKGVFDIEE